jgi:hypothetical protein
MVLGTPRERCDGGGGGGGMASGEARPTPLSASDTSTVSLLSNLHRHTFGSDLATVRFNHTSRTQD